MPSASRPPRYVSPHKLRRLLIMHQSSDEPLPLKFFNPATDLQRREPPVPPSTNLGIHAERVSVNFGQQAPPHHKSNSGFRRGSLSIPALGPLPPSSHFQTTFGATSIHDFSSPVEGNTGRPRYL